MPEREAGHRLTGVGELRMRVSSLSPCVSADGAAQGYLSDKRFFLLSDLKQLVIFHIYGQSRRVVVNRLSCGLASLLLLLLSVGLPVANAPDVLQPYYFLDVPTFTTSRLPRDILVAKGGTIWSRNGR